MPILLPLLLSVPGWLRWTPHISATRGEEPEAGSPAPPVTALRGEHFEIICHFEQTELGALALEAAEAAWPIARDIYGESPFDQRGDPKGPGGKNLHRIHLYPDAESYRAIEREITGGYFASNLAFTSWLTFESYIALQPSGDPDVRAGIGLSMLTRRLIAHEAVHQVCYRGIATHRMHPDWLSEGLANWISDRVMREKHWSLASEAEPYTSADITRVQELLAASRMPSIERILQVGIRGKAALQDFSAGERYALYWMLIDYLMSGEAREGFRHLMTSCRHLSGRRFPWTFIEDFNTFLVPGEIADLDAKFASHVRALAPQWKQVGRGLEWDGKAWMQLAFPEVSAIAWRRSEPIVGAYQLQGRLQWLGERKPDASILLGQRLLTSQVNLRLTLKPDGIVLLKQGSRTVAEGQIAKPDPAGMDFRMTVGSGQLRLHVGEELVLEEALDGLALDGRWGVAVDAGAVVRWGALRLIDLD